MIKRALRGGKRLVNAQGKPYMCEECPPCGAEAEDCCSVVYDCPTSDAVPIPCELQLIYTAGQAVPIRDQTYYSTAPLVYDHDAGGVSYYAASLVVGPITSAVEWASNVLISTCDTVFSYSNQGCDGEPEPNAAQITCDSFFTKNPGGECGDGFFAQTSTDCSLVLQDHVRFCDPGDGTVTLTRGSFTVLPVEGVPLIYGCSSTRNFLPPILCYSLSGCVGSESDFIYFYATGNGGVWSVPDNDVLGAGVQLSKGTAPGTYKLVVSKYTGGTDYCINQVYDNVTAVSCNPFILTKVITVTGTTFDDCCLVDEQYTVTITDCGEADSGPYWFCINNTTCFYGTVAEALAEGGITGGPFASEGDCTDACPVAEEAWYCIDDTSCFYGTAEAAALEGTVSGGPWNTEEECTSACGCCENIPNIDMAFTGGCLNGLSVTLVDGVYSDSIDMGSGCFYAVYASIECTGGVWNLTVTVHSNVKGCACDTSGELEAEFTPASCESPLPGDQEFAFTADECACGNTTISFALAV